MARKWFVLIAVSLMFFFVAGATFTSLGVVLFAMAGELHWSMAGAGASFSVLGLACCFASPLPAVLLRRIGSRWTMAASGALLALGFALASRADSLSVFYVAMVLLGVGFTLGANIPGVFLLVGWFSGRAAPLIGIYLMVGAFGGVVAPPLVEWIVSHGGGWRVNWEVMAVTAVVLGVLCAVLVQDAPAAAASATAETDQASSPWTYRSAITTPQFLVLAFGMVVTQTATTTLNSAAVPHFVHLGATTEFAAWMLAVQALLATLAKGAAGWLADRIDARWLLAAGLVIEGLGVLVLGVADSHALGYAFAIAFGIGWGTTYLAVTVLMMRYFGRDCGTALMSTVWLLTGVAAAGPFIAGAMADRFGSFAPVFNVCGLLLVPAALAALLMRPPRHKTAPLIAPGVAA